MHACWLMKYNELHIYQKKKKMSFINNKFECDQSQILDVEIYMYFRARMKSCLIMFNFLVKKVKPVIIELSNLDTYSNL
jgi:hypothetical protein